MTTPYENSVDDGEGTAAHPTGVPGATISTDYLASWYVPGYKAQLGPNGEFVYTNLVPSSSGPLDYANFPSDLVTKTTVTQRYFSPDEDPLGGFLTFWPSDAFTITENGESWRIPQRLSGTETWPSLDSGVSPWAFSMEGSGSIYIWRGFFVVTLFPTDSVNVVTDSGNPLTYHVIEHFVGGKQFDITVVTTTSVLDLYADCIVAGSIKPYEFDPINPMGSLLGEDLWETPAP